MASYLALDFPAVTDALEHLRELDKELREDEVASSAEASFHLSKITAALTELEGHQRAAQESLEAEKTENSKLAHRISSTKETVRQEITAGVAEVRTGSAEETDQLQKDLMEASQLQEAATKRQEDLVGQNEMLRAEKRRAQAEHEALVAALNRQVNVKNGLQMQLDRSREQIEELTSCSATAAQDKMTLQKGMELEREAFTVKLETVCREVERVEEEIKQQKQVVRRGRTELSRLNDTKQEAQGRLKELTFQAATLESSLQQAAASRCQCEEQLEGQTQTRRQLGERKRRLKKDLQESQVTSSTLIQRLKEELRAVEGQTEEGEASRELHRRALAHICQTLKLQRAEESEARADHLRAQQQLQRSRRRLDARVSSIARHRKEIAGMDEQMTALRQASALNRRLFERDLQEMSSTLEAQRRTTVRLEEDKRQLLQLLETARREQEERVAKLTSDIRSTKRRCQELLQEEAALQEQQLGRDADLLGRHLKQREAKYKEEEARQRQEVERYAADANVISQSNREKQRQLGEEEKRLEEVEAAWRAEERRHLRMKSLVAELKTRASDLELLLLELTEKSRSLLQPRERAMAQLEEVQRCSMEMLDSQTSELRDAEMSLYDWTVKLEQVRMENSRLHMCVRQMMEDKRRAEEDGDRYWEEARLIGQEVQDVLDSLQQRWDEDVAATRDRQGRDGALLRAMDATRSRLSSRREELETLSTRLQQQTLESSRQLGDRAVSVPQSLSAAPAARDALATARMLRKQNTI